MEHLAEYIEGVYAQTTHSITVTVEPEFLDDQSDPDEHRFVWAYHVTIHNQGHGTVKLKSRYWRITDALGHVQQVSGAGVVGEQPRLGPNEIFEYTSGTPLGTASGFMQGHYIMEDENGATFEVAIPAFSLDQPDRTRMLH
ncbi:MAG: Co2+/Mg2+ efflux protein ApaG [Alphaproteobacteria bacterium]|nr:Co2+/Mg2+ efflux protein ApaG [Alphaproteobacteria bacterium]MBF0251320.1 Co2+/Mg2+ efflux protein ApaG [Alphaproteobacteria bacterium]